MWGAKALVSAIFTFNVLVGCELETVYDPQLDEATFTTLLGPEVRSIVRRQPTISELVDKAMKGVNPVTQSSQKTHGGGIFQKLAPFYTR
jgi:hypothetical protein